jgi:hypothetical protein
MPGGKGPMVPCATEGCDKIVRRYGSRCARHRAAEWEKKNLTHVRAYQRLRKKSIPFKNTCPDCGQPCGGSRCGSCIGRYNGKLGASKPRKRRVKNDTTLPT